jgi:hypothetical protein
MKQEKQEKQEKQVARVRRPQQFGMPKIGMRGTGVYTPPPEHPTDEDKGD